ncbi:hypothetical protein [Actinophytocola oryzae]|uniref:PLL-like beta propeller domain-containing protein n=1 Tax=Actinophytocola oryzae TaxID=502181 RepID=A0A4V3FRN1_9PSEU|nr:hypothetical protein [Actinophytocola oryzae]TDV44251.1 hypothetical protein CLV71_114161 [Actinophytocola oryzae]
MKGSLSLLAGISLALVSTVDGSVATADPTDHLTDAGYTNQMSAASADTNPNPARITDESWWLMQQLLALQPGSQNGGIYDNKPGYHNTRDANAADDYSIRDPEDQGGPSDKAAAYDWTFPDAQSGNYATIAMYAQRLLASGQDPNDPRMDGWKEFFGQTNNDSHVEGWDFRRDKDATSKPSHLWHIHLSEDRDKVTSLDNKLAALSVLRGETVAQWRGKRSAVAVGADGQLQMFATGADGVPYVRHQISSGWSDWASMGGRVSGLTVAQNPDGRLEIFGTGTDGTPSHNWQLGTGGWSGWASLGGKVSGLAVGRNPDGRLELFGTAADGTSTHNWQLGTGGWSGWASMGGKVSGITAASNADGHLEIFGTAPDGTSSHNWQTASGWSGWASLGAKISGITTATNTDGRLELFGTAPDGTPSHNWQLGAGGWSGWAGMGGRVSGLAVGRNSDGRLEAFGTTSDGTSTHNWQLGTSGWSGWASMTGKFTGITAISNTDGRLEIFGTGTDGAIWHNWQLGPGQWSGWATLGRPA